MRYQRSVAVPVRGGSHESSASTAGPFTDPVIRCARHERQTRSLRHVAATVGVIPKRSAGGWEDWGKATGYETISNREDEKLETPLGHWSVSGNMCVRCDPA